MKRWYELSIGGWSALLGPSVSGRLFLICRDTTIIFAGDSLGELLASVLARLCRHIVNFNNQDRTHV
jgi:hypothetical protein